MNELKYDDVKSQIDAFTASLLDLRMKSFRHGFAIGAVLGFAIGFFCEAVYAAPRVYKLDLSYARLLHNSDPMVPDIKHEDWGDAVNLDIGVQAGRFYLDASPHFESAFHKVTTVGLLFQTGFEIASWLDLEWTHHSRHSSDRTNAYGTGGDQTPGYLNSARYPLYDSVGVVVHFIPNTRRQAR